MSAKDYATLERQFPDSFTGGKWTYQTRIDTVRVMARAEGYAMVRMKGLMPFVVKEKQLSAPPTQEPTRDAFNQRLYDAGWRTDAEHAEEDK